MLKRTQLLIEHQGLLQSSQMLLVSIISWSVVVPPPQLGLWRRLLKENLGRIIRVNIPAHIKQQ
jgi:hypothetical protein